ncbi:MAG TPA: hypothetical protein VI548_01590 [Chitinophagaceae bacterium]|nr:hypothetical protein [Chitinophagaceae bacterium]
MLFNRNHINRAVAGALLFALIFIHGVKLLHKHSFNLLAATPFTIITDATHTQHSTSFYFYSECDICNYQLTKDADNFVSKLVSPYAVPLIDHHSSLSLFQESAPFSSFENRGPPATTLLN